MTANVLVGVLLGVQDVGIGVSFEVSLSLVVAVKVVLRMRSSIVLLELLF